MKLNHLWEAFYIPGRSKCIKAILIMSHPPACSCKTGNFNNISNLNTPESSSVCISGFSLRFRREGIEICIRICHVTHAIRNYHIMTTILDQ